jgi:tetratricopeptide (TPR) repeat protein
MQRFEAGAVRALCLVNTVAGAQSHARQGRIVCEQTLACYGVLDRPDWQSHPEWRRLPARDRRRVAEDVRELLLLLARARVQTASRKAKSRVLRNALTLLERGEVIRGLRPSPALWEDRAVYREQLGDRKGARQARARAQALPARSARDHYLLATTFAGHHRYAEAVTELNRALRKNFRHYWSWLQRGICYQDQGEYALAAADFSACVVLWPEFAWGYFNRGQALQQLGKNEQARRDYTDALRRDPDLTYAYFNRGLTYLNLNRHRPALADFDAAAERGMDGVVLHGSRGIALEYLGRTRAADKAFARGWAKDPDNVPMLLGYGFAVARRAPARARKAFLRVLHREPRNPRALYGLAMLFTDRSAASPQALALLNRAVEADPTFVPARRGRALVLAHAGQGSQACQDVEWCVAVEPEGVTLYAAACVYALVADKTADPATAEALVRRSLAFLAEAFARGYGKDKAARDTDLKALRQRPEFRRLVRGGKP